MRLPRRVAGREIDAIVGEEDERILPASVGST
jgi:hypothetical protein